MRSVLSRVVAAVRLWIGLNDPAENRLYPSHGWLLPPASAVRARALALAVAPQISSAAGRRP
jgi:hypothetical protein